MLSGSYGVLRVTIGITAVMSSCRPGSRCDLPSKLCLVLSRCSAIASTYLPLAGRDRHSLVLHWSGPEPHAVPSTAEGQARLHVAHLSDRNGRRAVVALRPRS